jgi:carboxyl-terminal processing protease
MSKVVKIKTGTIVAVGLVSAGLFFGGYFTRTFVATRGANINPASLKEVESALVNKFDGSVDRSKLLDGAKEGLVASVGDPYTVYLNPKNAKMLADDLKGSLSGIGAEVGIRNKLLTIIAPLPGTPAARSGLRSGDVVVKINNTDPTGLSLDEAVSKIRGPKGSKVTLNISRSNGKPFDVVIIRENITVPSVNHSMKAGEVGYIQIVRFGTDTADKVDRAAGELLAQGAKKFVLDLRDDPGGYLDEAVKVASIFLEANQLVVEERRGNVSTDKEYSTGGGKLIGKPVIVLINGGSASASEIVAGALHDNTGAKLVGIKSFGKGSVQEIVNLSGGAELKVTVAHWYTPKGININKEGIKPDIAIELSPEDFSAGRDPQLEKALELL